MVIHRLCEQVLSRCDSCKGVKRLLALGGIQKQCDTCKGTGFVSVEEALKEVRKRRKPRLKEVINEPLEKEA